MQVEVYWSHSFLPGLIRPQGIVFDIGVNSGGLPEQVAGRCRRVIGFEPDPVWHASYVLPPNVQVWSKALAASRGTMRLNVNPKLCSSLHYQESASTSVEVETVTLADALALESEGPVDLIKIDIEGEELAVLDQSPAELFSRVVQMTVEFHDFLDPASRPKILAVIDRLRRLGFHVVKFSWNSYGDMLFVNRKLAPLSVWQRIWLRLRYKYGSGIGRILCRFCKQ